MKVIGITAGIGSLLVGARRAGFGVVGNIEWRKDYHLRDAAGRNTFLQNFEGATLHENLDHMTMDEIERFMGVELAMGHPECGNFSTLSAANRNYRERMLDPADIPLFVDIVARLKPRFFVMDDLPKSFMAYPMAEYAAKLPEYDLFPEWISNYNYGNVQKNRNRLFVIGSKREEQWAFTPGEVENTLTVRDVLEDLPEPRVGANIPNHDPHGTELFCYRGLNLRGYGNRPSWGEVKEYFKTLKCGESLKYTREDGSEVYRIGFVKGHWDKYAHVLTKGNPTLHPLRCDPYTIRERARIQGFPDDFVFYGTTFNERGEWYTDLNYPMTIQTGKAMPIQFGQYVATQVAAHVRGESFESSGQRVLKPNENVDQAKRWYCANVGYSDQARACGQCWMAARCEIRREKYKLGGLEAVPIPKPPKPPPYPKPPRPPPEQPRPPAARGLQNAPRKVIETKIIRI